jgi:perosamine synthetase
MIPHSEPYFSGNEFAALSHCIDTGWVSSAGPAVVELSTAIKELTQSPGVLALNSGTSALHLALIGCGVQAGDYVVIPDFTFIATANAVKYCGAEPILLDVHPQTWQSDISLWIEWLNENGVKKEGKCFHKKTGRCIRASILVHALGYPADAFKWATVCKEWGIETVEDAAGALGSMLQNKACGTIGRFGVISLNGNKIITGGSGGLLLCRDINDLSYLHHLSTQARLEGDLYEHDAVGFNYRMNNLTAALALAQLETLNYRIEIKKKIYQGYRSYFSQGIWPEIIPSAQPNYWMVAFINPDKEELFQKCKSAGLEVRTLWKPLHLQVPYQNCERINKISFAEKIWKLGISLPTSIGSFMDGFPSLSAII